MATTSGLAAGLLSAFIVTAVAHGLLRQTMEARGVVPWTLKDSIGALPLVILGSALSVASAVWLAVLLIAVNSTQLWGSLAAEPLAAAHFSNAGPSVCVNGMLSGVLPEALPVMLFPVLPALVAILAGLFMVRLGRLALHKLTS